MAISLFFKTKKNFQRGVIKVICDMKKKRNFSGSRIPTLHGCAHWPSVLRNKSIVHRSRQLFDTKAHRWPYRAVRLAIKYKRLWER